MKELRDLALAVYRHAEEHYEDGGWDVIVETMTIPDIVAQWKRHHEEFGSPIPTTVEEAIASFESAVSIWADREADARNSAF